MRHVSRTHRVALDWLFDRINLDTKIQIKYIDTKNQIADIVTQGNFTRDEWNNLLNLFNIRHFSSLRCTKSFSLISYITMAKRIQEQKEERMVSKSATFNELFFLSYCDKFLCRIKSDCIEKSGDCWSFGETRWQDESCSKFIRRSFSVSREIQGCMPWRVGHELQEKFDAKESTSLME